LIELPESMSDKVRARSCKRTKGVSQGSVNKWRSSDPTAGVDNDRSLQR
jgi:hypothetical protein